METAVYKINLLETETPYGLTVLVTSTRKLCYFLSKNS
jgi:hypothetical protein